MKLKIIGDCINVYASFSPKVATSMICNAIYWVLIILFPIKMNTIWVNRQLSLKTVSFVNYPLTLTKFQLPSEIAQH